MSMIARTRSALKSAYTNSALNFQRRHGSGGVNAWEAPTDPAAWKGEHTVIAVLTGWTVVIYGATQAFGGKKKDAPAAAPPPAPAPEKVVAKAEAVVTEVKETAAKAVSTGIDSVQKSIDAVAEGK